jgi:hypothetical protein
MADHNAGLQNTYQLAWKEIAEILNAKVEFCSTDPIQAKDKDGNLRNFALEPNMSVLALPSTIKISKEDKDIKAQLARWQKNYWEDLPSMTVQLDPNSITIDTNTITDGFYKLSVKYTEGDTGRNCDFYAIITRDWKKDLLAYCRNSREHIEAYPDPHFIYSSIAASHFDHLMEITSKSSVLSENILETLCRAITSKTELEQGKCPDLVKGLNRIKLKRFEGAEITVFTISLPENYDGGKKWPMLIYPDPRQIGLVSSYINSSGIIKLWWHFQKPLGYKWKDYKYLLNILRDKINIDEDRIYINGECRNGIAAIDLGLKHPDQWAECSASLGNASRHLAGSALNLPLIFVRGSHEGNQLTGYYDFAVECFKYYGCKFFKHSETLTTAEVRGGSIPTEQKIISPYRVFYTTESLADSSAYWVQIDGREDENFIASIDAVVSRQTIRLKTNNIDAYTLNLESAPVDHTQDVEIIENAKHLGYVTGAVFNKQSEKYKNAIYIKNKSLHGPVADVFTDQYVVVWTGDKANEEIAKKLANSGLYFADINLPADIIDTHNIVFVGKLQESKRFAAVANKLPVIIEDGKLTTNGQIYEGDLGAIFIYPNPLNTQRYIAVFSGTSKKAVENITEAWSQIEAGDNADIGIFEVTEASQTKWLRREKFNTIWDWHKAWSIPLINLKKSHPKWKWSQWIAKVLREQIKADVIIFDDMFESSELPTVGEITLRDLCRVFKNDWIIRISLRGNDLRDLLTVSFNDISSREVPAPTIDGISLVNQTTSNILCIDKLDNEKLYTIAFPYKALNGRNIGMVMKNYHLEHDGFLILLLNEYLSKNINIDIDAEIDNVQLNIF